MSVGSGRDGQPSPANRIEVQPLRAKESEAKARSPR
jgi:hypothetical protein